MITQNLKYSIKYTFEKLQEAYSNLKVGDSQDYFLTLGNVNEVHLMKKDATKSVFLGKLFSDANSTQEVEARKIWNVLQAYFRGTVVEEPTKEPKVETKPLEVETKPTKKTAARKSKKVEPIEIEEEIHEPEVEEADEDSPWLDTIL